MSKKWDKVVADAKMGVCKNCNHPIGINQGKLYHIAYIKRVHFIVYHSSCKVGDSKGYDCNCYKPEYSGRKNKW